MRRLRLLAPEAQGSRLLEAAHAHAGKNLASMPVHDGRNAAVLVVADIPNDRVGAMLAALADVPKLHVTLEPQGIMALAPPGIADPGQVIDVAPRSALEIYLSGLQSVGSWKGFLSYAAAAGALGWIGLYTDTVYLLVAAMLIAPFASPAMNLAIGTAYGERRLIVRSLGRYASAIATAILTSGALSMVFGLDTVTAQMAAASNLSNSAFLLPLVAGAAGALSQVQSERASLVSGAAVGILVAASLAPPSALVGMALVLGRGDLAMAGGFQLVLQLLGINLSGVIVFRFHGLVPGSLPTPRGSVRLMTLSLLVTTLGLAGLLAWQFSPSPALQEGSLSREAVALIRQEVEASGEAELVEARAHVPRGTNARQSLLCEVFVLRRSPVAPDELKALLTRRLQQRLLEAEGASVPLVTVTVLESP